VRKAPSDKPTAPTHRKGAALLAALVLASAGIGAQAASAQTGGTTSPGDTTTAPAPSSGTSAEIFPVSGAHSFGDGFGAARSGHSHQGQDIMAACGTPLVAVSRAKVKRVSYQRSAGNYVVIRNKQLKQDYMYAHLATRAPVTKGQVVQPGQQVATVGRTGNARACHLHFELWLGKWYRGGHPVDPMPYLRTYQGY
jgi:murein DD-endopeptidase MepM/ murein hydrolase activator NlpD